MYYSLRRADYITPTVVLSLVLALWCSANTVAAAQRRTPPAPGPQYPQSPSSPKPAEVARLLELADHGDRNAQFSLGLLYAKPYWYAQASSWYRKAGDQGHAEAQSKLLDLCQYGQGLPQDCAQVLIWRHRAADQGDTSAQIALGIVWVRYADHAQAADRALDANAKEQKAAFQTGLPRSDLPTYARQADYARAASWYRKAADQGNATAQFALAGMYVTGRGVPHDYAEAYKWTTLAATRAFPDEEASKKYADARNVVARFLTAGQIAVAQKRASEWLAAFEKRVPK